MGTAKVKFPRRFALTDKKALIGHRVKYSKFYELYEECGSDCAGYTHKYKLNILTGPLAGEEIKERILS